MTERNDKLKQLFLYLLIINPFIDVATSLYLKVLKGSSKLTPGIVIRNLLLVCLIFYVIKNKEKVKTVGLLFITLIITILVQIITVKNYSLFLEIQYYFRFLLNFLLLIFAENIIKRDKFSFLTVEQILKYTNISGFIVASIILLSFIFGVDFKTYANSISSKGLFYAGNDVAAILAVIYPISIYFLLKLEGLFNYNFIMYVFILLSMVIVGTRVSQISILFTMFIFFIYSILNRNKNLLIKMVNIFLISVICTFLFIKGALYFKNINIVQHNIERQVENFEKTNEDTTTYVLSSRNIKFKEAYQEYLESKVLRKVFGIGRGSQKLTIEMDFAEVFIYYGIFGAFTMILPIALRGIKFITNFVKYKNDVLYIVLFTSLALGFGSSFIAGHVLFSTSGLYAFIVLAVSSVFVRKDVN